jgi:hypothetical protein
LGVQAPYFFLSYHRAPSDDPGQGEDDEDAYVLTFYKDLSRHIRHFTDLDPKISPGYLDRNMHTGVQWMPEVKKALAECQTFVALYEPSYFRSRFCGFEWAGFEARQALGRPPGSLAYDAIIPVLMVGEGWLPDPLPPGVKGLQYTDPALRTLYRQHGIYGLQFGGHTQDYRRTTMAIAQRIVAVAGTNRIAPCSVDVFDDDADAFAGVAP